MASDWLGVNAGNITSGWHAPPQLQGRDLSSIVAATLRERLLREQQQGEAIANAIKNVREERQSNEYLEAAKAAGLIPQDYEAGGVGGATLGTGLAKMILAKQQEERQQQEAESVAKYRDIMAGAATTRADAAARYYDQPEEEEGPLEWTNEETGERFQGKRDKYGRVTWTRMAQAAQPQSTKELSPSQINSLVKGYGLDRADITGGTHAGFKGGEPLPKDRPWEEAEEIEVTPRAGGPPVKIPLSVFKQLKEQVYGTEEDAPPVVGGGADKNVAQGYGSDATSMSADEVRAAYKAGRMTREEATARLKQLGFGD